MTDELQKEDQEIVAMELESDEETAPEEEKSEPVRRGRLESQRKELNLLYKTADRAQAVILNDDYRQALNESDYTTEDMTELEEDYQRLREKDLSYIKALRQQHKTTRAQKKAVHEACEQIRKAKRRGRNLVSRQPDLKEEFCIGVHLQLSVPSIRYQGPLLLEATRDYFEQLPRYNEKDVAALERSLAHLEKAVVTQNRATIRARKARRLRDQAVEALREELADLRLSAEIAAEITPNILNDL